MAYLHCHSCNWEQDDFWSKNYNPIKFLYENYEEYLLSEDLDEIIGMDSEWLEENNLEFATKRILIIHQLQRMIRNIENMKFPKYEDFKKNPKVKCPKCLGCNWDID